MSSISSTGKTGQLHKRMELECFHTPHTYINSNGLKTDMQARNNKTPRRKHHQNTLDIYCSNAYSDLSHWGRKTKAKICKCNWINLKIFLQQKQTKENHWRKKKITCWIEENICKQSNSKPLIFKIYKQATQYEKHKQHNFKNGQRIFHLSSWLLCR